MTMQVQNAREPTHTTRFEKVSIRSLLAMGHSIEGEMEEILSAGVSDAFLPIVLWQVRCGGKRLRPILTLLFAEALGNPQPGATVAAACGIELIHNCSLIFDDIMDNGTVRRNRPTVRAAYSDNFAILAGLQHREAVSECAARTGENARRVEQVYSEAIRQIIEGQRLDLLFEQGEAGGHAYFLQHRYRKVSFEDYFYMVRRKTAELIAAACRLGVLVAGGAEALQEAAAAYGANLGVAFQMLDDYLDIFADPRLGTFGKEPFKDIRERKLGNYVLLKTCDALPPEEASELFSLLRGTVLGEEETRVRRCVLLIEKACVKESIRQDARRWTERAKAAIRGKVTGTANDALGMIADVLADRTF